MGSCLAKNFGRRNDVYVPEPGVVSFVPIKDLESEVFSTSASTLTDFGDLFSDTLFEVTPKKEKVKKEKNKKEVKMEKEKKVVKKDEDKEEKKVVIKKQKIKKVISKNSSNKPCTFCPTCKPVVSIEDLHKELQLLDLCNRMCIFEEKLAAEKGFSKMLVSKKVPTPTPVTSIPSSSSADSNQILPDEPPNEKPNEPPEDFPPLDEGRKEDVEQWVAQSNHSLKEGAYEDVRDGVQDPTEIGYFFLSSSSTSCSSFSEVKDD